MTHELFKRKPQEAERPLGKTPEETAAAPSDVRQTRPDIAALAQRLQSEAAALRQSVPGFDLAQAMTNPKFMQLVKAGLPMAEAWSALKQPELLRQAFDAGVKQGRQQAVLERNQSRPMENGAAPAGILSGLDPAHLSRAQRRDIHDRVRRGEEVRF